MIINDFTINNKYTFSLFDQVDGRTTFNATVIGKGTYRSIPASIDLASLHQQIWGSISDDIKENYTENSFKEYPYLTLVHESDDTIFYVGIPWIKNATIIEDRILMVSVANFSDQSFERIKSILKNGGYDVGDMYIK